MFNDSIYLFVVVVVFYNDGEEEEDLKFVNKFDVL